MRAPTLVLGMSLYSVGLFSDLAVLTHGGLIIAAICGVTLYEPQRSVAMLVMALHFRSSCLRGFSCAYCVVVLWNSHAFCFPGAVCSTYKGSILAYILVHRLS